MLVASTLTLAKKMALMHVRRYLTNIVMTSPKMISSLSYFPWFSSSTFLSLMENCSSSVLGLPWVVNQLLTMPIYSWQQLTNRLLTWHFKKHFKISKSNFTNVFWMTFFSSLTQQQPNYMSSYQPSIISTQV